MCCHCEMTLLRDGGSAVDPWHYTDLKGLMGIVEHSELWATDLRYLNDSSEFDYGMKQALRFLSSDASAEPDAAKRKAVAKALKKFVTNNTIHAYVVCFSRHDDHLSLWRGYGQQGYALGFQRKVLEQHFDVTHVVDPSRPHLQELAYSESHQKNLVKTAVKQHGQAPEITSTAFSDYIDDLARHLYILIGALKHPAFRDEGEIRLTFRRSSTEEGGVKFREGPLGPTPYLVLPLPGHGEAPEASSLRKVVMGPTPHPAEAEAGVRHLLAVSGLAHVAVRRSKVPLRW